MTAVVQLPIPATYQTQTLMIGAEFLPQATVTPEALVSEIATKMLSHPDVAVEILLAGMNRVLRVKPDLMFQLVIQASLAVDQSVVRRLR